MEKIVKGMTLLAGVVILAACSKSGTGNPEEPMKWREPAKMELLSVFVRKDGAKVRYIKNVAVETEEKEIIDYGLEVRVDGRPVIDMKPSVPLKDTTVGGKAHRIYEYEIVDLAENTPFGFTHHYTWRKSASETVPVTDESRAGLRTCLGKMPVMYIAPDGDPNADGRSWATAVGSIRQAYALQKKLGEEANPYSTNDKIYRAEVYSDSLMAKADWIYLIKEGTYKFGAEEAAHNKEYMGYGKMGCFIGGFRGTETGQTPEGGKSVFDGEGQYPLFKGDGSFKNIVFQNGGTSSGASTTIVDVGYGGFEDCDFIGNVNMKKGVGAVYLGGATPTDPIEAWPVVKFLNCNFEKNIAGGNGGAVGTGGFIKVIFDRCSFRDNEAGVAYKNEQWQNGYGGAIGGGEFEISDCLFENNSALEAAAIYTTGITSVKNCIFRNNKNIFRFDTGDKPAGGGIIYLKYKENWIDLGGNVFEGNNAANVMWEVQANN